MKTPAIATIADIAGEGVRYIAQNLSWDYTFLPVAGWFDTDHKYYVDIGDLKIIRIVTDANKVIHIQWYRADEDPRQLIAAVAELCRHFHVKWILADGRGTGLTTNRLLLDQLAYRVHLYGIVYSEHNHEPVQDGTVWMWTVNRSSSIGLLYTSVRKGYIEFPAVKECGWFLDELACELAEYDDEKHRIRYTHPENQRDDALHATNYAMILLNRWLDFVPQDNMSDDY